MNNIELKNLDEALSLLDGKKDINQIIKENAIYNLRNYFNGPSLDLDDVIDESVDADEGYGAKLRPVFIILLYSDSRFDHVAEKFVKNQSYWHASMSFGPALSKCYSFNFGECDANKFKGGLSFESLDFYRKEHPTGTMEVSCIFLGDKTYHELRETLDYYIHNKEKTKYSFINLVYSLFGHHTKNGTKFNLVCSTFVDTILKSVNINVSGQKYSNLVKPDDLKAAEYKSKQFKIYEGKILGYKYENIKEKVDKLADDVNNDYFKDKK